MLFKKTDWWSVKTRLQAQVAEPCVLDLGYGSANE